MPNYGNLSVGPKLHNWAKENPEKISSARAVMRQVMSQFFESEVELGEDEAGHMGFAANLRESGGIHLQVFGNCACMGPDPNGYLINNQFEYGFAEYGLHKIDSEAHHVSIYAVLVHLAALATGKKTLRNKLFTFNIYTYKHN